jgi:hypothetical protein
VLGIFGLRFITQVIVMFKTTRKLDEKDLFPLFVLFDMWMFFYYLYFASALFKKPQKNWK